MLDGRPVGLERHLQPARIQPAGAVRRRACPPTSSTSCWRRRRGSNRGRLRVNVRPQAGGVGTDVELTAPVRRRIPVRLRAVTVPGGLGAHKWIDRRLLDGVGGRHAGRATAVRPGRPRARGGPRERVRRRGRGCVATPPADGRILPGVTRARVLELARELGLDVRVEPIDLRRLARADEIFVTGAIGGVEPAQLGAARRRAMATVTAQLARAWRELGAAGSPVQPEHARQRRRAPARLGHRWASRSGSVPRSAGASPTTSPRVASRTVGAAARRPRLPPRRDGSAGGAGARDRRAGAR